MPYREGARAQRDSRPYGARTDIIAIKEDIMPTCKNHGRKTNGFSGPDKTNTDGVLRSLRMRGIAIPETPCGTVREQNTQDDTPQNGFGRNSPFLSPAAGGYGGYAPTGGSRTS